MRLPVIERESGWVYGTKVTGPGGVARNGFVWPDAGVVESPDWSPEPACGGGLHFWEDGCGDAGAYAVTADSEWRLVRAREDGEFVRLGGKVKSRHVEVLFRNTRETVTAEMGRLAPDKPVLFGIAGAGDYGTATAGDYGTATAGDQGTATAGYGGTATAGYGGTATAGDYGTATAGHRGTATAGTRGTATAGDRGTATAGDQGTATAGDQGTATAGCGGTATAGYGGTATAGYSGTTTAGDQGTATAGDRGTATAGDDGTATAGDRGTATAGYRGTATAGDRGVIIIKYWGDARLRLAIGYVGEAGIEPDKPYTLDAGHKLIPTGGV